jgi:hypothetical protein
VRLLSLLHCLSKPCSSADALTRAKYASPTRVIGSVFSPELGVGPITLHSVDTRPTKEGGAVFRTADPVRPYIRSTSGVVPAGD